MNKLIVDNKSITLERIPRSDSQTGKTDNLRAWDAADEYILHHLQQSETNSGLSAYKNILVVNDAFGALTTALIVKKQIINAPLTQSFSNQDSDQFQQFISCWSDSHISLIATQQNLALNQLQDGFTFYPAHQAPAYNNRVNTDLLNIDRANIDRATNKTNDKFDLVIVKIPKTLSLLEYQLSQLKPYLNPDSQVIAAGMSKHIHTSTLDCFEKYMGTTQTSLARKKARLIYSQNDNPLPASCAYPREYSDKEFDLTLGNHANVFSRDRLDIGARFMMQQLNKHLPQCHEIAHIIDLGCGNGALGIIAQRLLPEAKLSFVDESYMAIDSAKTNYTRNVTKFVESNLSDNFKNSTTPSKKIPPPTFHVSNCLDSFVLKEGSEKVDLILCNPPFHQAHAIGDQTAWQMFTQSLDLLNAGGELWVVGNRHLAYHAKLKRLFGNCRTLASNKKFVVLVARKAENRQASRK